MTLTELNKQIKKGDFKRIYVFTGEEPVLIDRCINNLPGIKMRAEKLSETMQQFGSMGLFKERKCYIIKDDKEAIEKGFKSLCEYVDNIKNDNILVLIYAKPDGRVKFFKDAKDNMIEFKKLNTDGAAKFIMDEVDVKSNIAEMIALRCGNDLSRILMECDKLKMLDCEITEDIVNDVIFMAPEDAIFSMIDCMINRDIQRAYDYYYDLQRLKESPVKIITLTYNSFRNMLQIQTLVEAGMNTDAIAEKTGINKWLIGKTKGMLGKYSTSKLVSALKLLQSIDVAIKSGRLEIDLSVDYFLLSL